MPGRCADGIHRIPLPLPMDGLKAVNVYAIETEHGLTLIDGGWAIEVARAACWRSRLRDMGYGFGDIRRFLVTHIHRDHYTHGRRARAGVGADVALGSGRGARPRPACNDLEDLAENPTVRALRSAGAADVAEEWERTTTARDARPGDVGPTRTPGWTATTRSRSGPARSTPCTRRGTRPGTSSSPTAPTGLLFAGDHVLPTITPSIGFEPMPSSQPLRDFMASLTKVRGLPDLRLLPAHGPVAPSSHTRSTSCSPSTRTGWPVPGRPRPPARRPARTSHASCRGPGTSSGYDDLDVFNRRMASMETKAHLELLVARGVASVEEGDEGVLEFAAVDGVGGRD